VGFLPSVPVLLIQRRRLAEARREGAQLRAQCAALEAYLAYLRESGGRLAKPRSTG
jgi:BMFP domain-containing protein YqiC